MTREELIQNMEAIDCDGTSSLKMRSENAQRGNRVARIPSLKKKLKKKSKLLLICELAIPFDPVTGETEKYNRDNKWRPPFSATTVAKLLKGNANENEKLKTVLMRRAGVKEWDTSNCDEITDKDIHVFMPYRVPRVFTVPVISVNIPAITGNNEYGRDYAIDINYDEKTGQIIGEKPGAIKVSELYTDLAFEEIAELEEKVRSGELNLTDQQVRDKKQEIRNKIRVTGDHPANFITVIELPMTAKMDISDEFLGSPINKEAIVNALVLTRYSKKIRLKMEEYTSGNWEKFDYTLDYVELDMSCPTEGDENSSIGKQRIGLDTSFDKPATKLTEEEQYADIKSAISEYLDNDCTDIEEKVYRSTYIAPYSDDIEDQIYTSLHTVLDIVNNQYATKRVLQKHSEVINLAYGEDGQDLLMEVNSDVSEKPEGRLADERTIADVAKSYDLNSADFAGDLEEVSPDLE